MKNIKEDLYGFYLMNQNRDHNKADWDNWLNGKNQLLKLLDYRLFVNEEQLDQVSLLVVI